MDADDLQNIKEVLHTMHLALSDEILQTISDTFSDALLFISDSFVIDLGEASSLNSFIKQGTAELSPLAPSCPSMNRSRV